MEFAPIAESQLILYNDNASAKDNRPYSDCPVTAYLMQR